MCRMAMARQETVRPIEWTRAWLAPAKRAWPTEAGPAATGDGSAAGAASAASTAPRARAAAMAPQATIAAPWRLPRRGRPPPGAAARRPDVRMEGGLGGSVLKGAYFSTARETGRPARRLGPAGPARRPVPSPPAAPRGLAGAGAEAGVVAAADHAADGRVALGGVGATLGLLEGPALQPPKRLP